MDSGPAIRAVKQINRPALSALREQDRASSSSVTARAQGGDPKTEPLMRTVSYAGLKLTRPADDVALLYGRIAAAADLVCDPVAVGSDTAAKLRVKRCVAESIARAVADVNSPALSRYYAAKTPQMEASVARSDAH
jgi:UrcA family protein